MGGRDTVLVIERPLTYDPRLATSSRSRAIYLLKQEAGDRRSTGPRFEMTNLVLELLRVSTQFSIWDLA